MLFLDAPVLAAAIRTE